MSEDIVDELSRLIILTEAYEHEEAEFPPVSTAWVMGRAKSEIEALRAQVLDLTDPKLKSMRFEDGRLNVALGGEAAKRIALVMTEWFRESSAKNYVEMTLVAPDDPFERYQFYVQKQGGGAKTPHQLREEAEAENENLRAQVAAVREATVEECAKVAENMPKLIHTTEAHVRQLNGGDVAKAIRALSPTSTPAAGAE